MLLFILFSILNGRILSINQSLFSNRHIYAFGHLQIYFKQYGQDRITYKKHTYTCIHNNMKKRIKWINTHIQTKSKYLIYYNKNL